MKQGEKIEIIRFFIKLVFSCYEQTSPLAVYTYSFGFPKTKVLARFVHSEAFFPIPSKTKTGTVKKPSFLQSLLSDRKS